MKLLPTIFSGMVAFESSFVYLDLAENDSVNLDYVEVGYNEFDSADVHFEMEISE